MGKIFLLYENIQAGDNTFASPGILKLLCARYGCPYLMASEAREITPYGDVRGNKRIYAQNSIRFSELVKITERYPLTLTINE